MTFPHQGIRIDRIPAEEGGGLIFMIGIVVMFLIGVPAMRPVVGLAALGGVLMAPLLYWLHR
jgi:hypothetical protein